MANKLRELLAELTWPLRGRRVTIAMKRDMDTLLGRLGSIEASIAAASTPQEPPPPPSHSSDEVWRKLSEQDPYWAVVSLPQNRNAIFDEKARGEFFAGGEELVSEVFGTIAERFSADPVSLKDVLDFGCGVGRLTVALVKRDHAVTGLDVSPRMLEICKQNLAEEGRQARLVLADDHLSALPDNHFDLCLSNIVFQHIEQSRGLATFRRLFECVKPGGFMSHFFLFSPEHRGGPVRIGTGVEQNIEMNEYDLNQLLSLCAEFSSAVYLDLMQHGPHNAMNLFARKRL